MKSQQQTEEMLESITASEEENPGWTKEGAQAALQWVLEQRSDESMEAILG